MSNRGKRNRLTLQARLRDAHVKGTGTRLEAHEVKRVIDAFSNTTPARAEAQDEGATGEAVAWRDDDLETLISDAIGDSFDYDWDAGDGAKAVMRALKREGLSLYAHPSPTPAADADRVRELEGEVTHLRDALLGIAESDHYRRYPKQHEDGGVRGQSGLRAVRALTGQHGSYINDVEVRRLDAEKRAALKSTAAKEGEA